MKGQKEGSNDPEASEKPAFVGESLMDWVELIALITIVVVVAYLLGTCHISS